jgi:hypothetical protein
MYLQNVDLQNATRQNVDLHNVTIKITGSQIDRVLNKTTKPGPNPTTIVSYNAWFFFEAKNMPFNLKALAYYVQRWSCVCSFK